MELNDIPLELIKGWQECNKEAEYKLFNETELWTKSCKAVEKHDRRYCNKTYGSSILDNESIAGCALSAFMDALENIKKWEIQNVGAFLGNIYILSKEKCQGFVNKEAWKKIMEGISLDKPIRTKEIEEARTTFGELLPVNVKDRPDAEIWREKLNELYVKIVKSFETQLKEKTVDKKHFSCLKKVYKELNSKLSFREWLLGFIYQSTHQEEVYKAITSAKCCSCHKNRDTYDTHNRRLRIALNEFREGAGQKDFDMLNVIKYYMKEGKIQ